MRSALRCREGYETVKHIGTRPFETDRLLCRPFTWADGGDMIENWASDPDIQREYGEPVYKDRAQVQELLKRYLAGYQRPDFYRWAIVERASGKNIGQIAFCRVYADCAAAEIEYCIGKSFWGKGYAGEALAGLIRFTFQYTGFQKLEAYHRAANHKSGRVLEKSSMRVADTVERFVRQGLLPTGEVCYRITREEWEAVR